MCLLVLWLNHRFDLTVDVSANARHTLTETTVQTLSLMPMPLNLIAVIGPSEQQRTAISDLVVKLRKHKGDISLSFVNPEIEPDKVRELNSPPGGELIMQYQGREKRLQNLSERSFTQALHQLSRSNSRHVAFIKGHGERTPDRQTNDDFAYLSARLGQSGIETSTLSLVQVPRVPDNIDTLVIAAPTEKYFPGEVASILEYLGRGGNLLWLIDGDTLAGLKSVSLELGFDLLPGVVIDANSSAWGTESPTFAIIDNYPNHAINTGLQSPLLLPQVKALSVIPQAGQTVTPLLQTRAESWTETGPIQGAIKFDENSEEARGPLTVALSIERERAGREQRIVVAGDADLFASTWIGNGANQDYAERLFNWMASDDNLIQFTTIQAKDSRVQLSTRQTIVVGAGFLLLLPLLFLAIGTFQWYRQKHV